MMIVTVLYYLACVIVWSGLTVVAIGVIRPGFSEWILRHPKVMIVLLGTDRLPDRPTRTLRRCYLFLYGGFTWLLVWSWWIMPAVKSYFYRTADTGMAGQISYYSTLGVFVLYAAVGFLGIARAISIWFKEIYSPVIRSRAGLDKLNPKK